MRGQAATVDTPRRPALLPPLRWARRGLRLAARLALTLTLIAGLALGALTWRLSQGPIEIVWLEPRLQAGLPVAGGVVQAQRVSLAWDGWNRGAAAFPAIRLDGVTFAAEAAAATADAVLVHLSVAALLRGEVAPTLLELHAPVLTLSGLGEGEDAAPDADLMRPWLAAPDESRAHLALRGLRVRDGQITLAATRGRPALTLENIDIEALRGSGGLSARGTGLLRLPNAQIPLALEGEGATDGHSSLRGRAVGVRPAVLIPLVPELLPLAPLDAAVDVTATLTLDTALAPRGLELALEAGPGRLMLERAGIAFRGLSLRAVLHTAGGQIPSAAVTLPSGETLQADGRAWREAGLWQAETNLAIPSLDLSGLAALWPEAAEPALREQVLAQLRQGMVRDASAQLVMRLTEFGPRLVSAAARLPLHDLRLGAGNGIGVTEALFRLAGNGSTWRMEEAMLRLTSPRPGTPPTILTGSAEATRQAAGWRASGELALDQLGFADLAAFWPPALAPSPRGWLTSNITAGSVRNGAWRFEMALPDGGAPRLLGLNGRARAEAATVQWLAPIPPVIGVSGEAIFTADSVTVTTEGGRQSRPDGTATGIELGNGTLRFFDLGGAAEKADLSFQLGGSLPDLLTLLRHPRLHLFDRRPLDLVLLDGRHSSQVTIGFPLLNDIPNDAIRVRAEGRLSQLRVARALLGRDFENGAAELYVDQDRLRIQGTANLLGAPLRLTTEMDFRPGPANQVATRDSAQGTLSAAQLAQLGFDLGDVLGGSVAIEGRGERRRNGQSTVTLRADLAPATLSLTAARWGKRVGSPGSAEAILRLQGDTLVAVENGRVDVLDLSLRGRAIVNRGRIERYELTESLFGASRFQGEVRPPTQPDGPWQASLRGPLLDLRPIMAERRPEEPPAAAGNSPPLVLEARFDRVTMGEQRELFGVQGRAVVDERGVMRQGNLRGRTAPAAGSFDLAVAPRGPGRTLRITAENGGAVLRALDNITAIEGGRLTLNGSWAGNEPGAPLTGTAELDGFVVRGAPAIGKLLQAMTLYGMLDALQGGQGLAFARAEVPFTLTREALAVIDARAFSASLGLTARGRVLREADILDIEGTIVPAYMFNSLLGNLPVLGRLFSPEPGGGVFATAYRVQGPAADPQVQVNPLSTLTPGFLRGLFGLGQQPPTPRR